LQHSNGPEPEQFPATRQFRVLVPWKASPIQPLATSMRHRTASGSVATFGLDAV
jgi:hypothetical protein